MFGLFFTAFESAFHLYVMGSALLYALHCGQQIIALVHSVPHLRQ